MKSPYALWALMFSTVLLAFSVWFSMRTFWGKRDVENPTKKGLELLAKGRELDRAGRARLEDLGLRFAEATKEAEPSLDIDNPSDADFRFLESVLASNDEKARVSAAKVLRDIGEPRSVATLVGAIRGIDKIDEFLLECALTIVNRLPHDQRAAALVPAWELHAPSLAEEPRDALRLKLRDVGALDRKWLEETLKHHDDPVFRRYAVRELLATKDPPAGLFAAALGDSDPEVRTRAGAALDALAKP